MKSLLPMTVPVYDLLCPILLRQMSERAVLLLMIVDFIKYQNHLEDGGFRASVTHISEKAQISPSMAKIIPRKLAARNLIIRKSDKPSTKPLVKISSLYGKLVTWNTLGDDLAKLYHDALIGTEEHLPRKRLPVWKKSSAPHAPSMRSFVSICRLMN